jgi:hypothetical protein
MLVIAALALCEGRNLNDYIGRHRGSLHGALAHVAQLIGFLARAAMYAIGSLADHKHWSMARAHWRNARTRLVRGHV